jgi:hypothetical protein
MGSHWIPQEYLRGFADSDAPGELYMYDRRTRQFRRAAIATLAQGRGYFDPETETRLSREVEGRGHCALNRLRNERCVPAQDERVWLALYLATMLMRVPARRRKTLALFPEVLDDTLADVTQTINAWANAPQADPALVARRRAEVERIRERYREAPPPQVLEHVRSPWPAEKYVALIHDMAWRVLPTDERQHFVTSDNPAYFFEAYGLGSPESELTFPLSGDLALHASWQGRRASTTFVAGWLRGVMEVNRRTVCGADRFVYCRSPEDWINKVAGKPNPFLSRLVWGANSP